MYKANANSAKPREKQSYLEEMLLGDPSFAYKMLIEVGQTERRYSMEARSHSGTPVFRNETLSSNPGEAQGESEKYLSSPPQIFPGPYLVAFQEWRPQLALGLPEVKI